MKKQCIDAVTLPRLGFVSGEQSVMPLQSIVWRLYWYLCATEWINSITAVIWCKSFWLVSCLSALRWKKKMNGCLKGFDGSANRIHTTCHVGRAHTHRHTSQKRYWAIIGLCVGWLALIFDQGCVKQIRNQIHIKYDPPKDKYSPSSHKFHASAIVSQFQSIYWLCVLQSTADHSTE